MVQPKSKKTQLLDVVVDVKVAQFHWVSFVLKHLNAYHQTHFNTVLAEGAAFGAVFV